MTEPYPSQRRLADLIASGAVLTECHDGTVLVEHDECGLFYVQQKEVRIARTIGHGPRSRDVEATGLSDYPRASAEGVKASTALRAMLADADKRGRGVGRGG